MREELADLPPEEKQAKKMQYLRQSKLPRLPKDALTALKMEFTEEEFL